MTRTSHRLFLGTLAAAVLVLAAAPAAAQSAAAGDPRGRWITASGNLEVEVAPCGAALCGTVTQVLANRSMSREGGEMSAVDSRPALGMTLLRDFTPVAADDAGAPTEWAGEIYNRENGNTYRCTLRVSTAAKPDGELIVHPYIGLPLFGKTQRWQRVAGAAR